MKKFILCCILLLSGCANHVLTTLPEYNAATERGPVFAGQDDDAIFPNDIMAIQEDSKERRNKAVVLKVHDGDTITFRLLDEDSAEFGDEPLRGRLLCVDTSELSDDHLFSKEAKAFTEAYLLNETVFVEFAVNNKKDVYERELIYVFLEDGTLFNELLVENGLARVAYVIEPDTKYVDRLLKAQDRARESVLGIWSVPGFVTSNGFDNNAAYGSFDLGDWDKIFNNETVEKLIEAGLSEIGLDADVSEAVSLIESIFRIIESP